MEIGQPSLRWTVETKVQSQGIVQILQFLVFALMFFSCVHTSHDDDVFYEVLKEEANEFCESFALDINFQKLQRVQNAYSLETLLKELPNASFIGKMYKDKTLWPKQSCATLVDAWFQSPLGAEVLMGQSFNPLPSQLHTKSVFFQVKTTLAAFVKLLYRINNTDTDTVIILV